MRKIVAASIVGLALVAGQAVAANGAAQSLRAGDRVGASLGAEREDFLVPLTSWIASLGPIVGTVVVAGITYAIVETVNVVIDDDDSPS